MGKIKTVTLSFLIENDYTLVGESNEYQYYFPWMYSGEKSPIVKIKKDYVQRWLAFKAIECDELSYKKALILWRVNERNAKWYKIAPMQEIEKRLREHEDKQLFGMTWGELWNE